MKTAIQIRRTRPEDLIAAMTLVMNTFNYLRKQHSMKKLKFNFREIPPFPKHLLDNDAKASFCAWKGRKIVGYTQAVNRGKQWYLAYLFVDPTVQDTGVGRKLLEKVWRDGPGVTHALCTFSFNMQAVGIYSQFGMAPLMTLPCLQGKPGKFIMPKSTGLKVSSELTADDIRWINSLEKKIRGYARPEEWKLWSTSELYRPCIFRDKGKRVAYGLLHKKMGIGPIGAIDNKYTVMAAAELIRMAEPQEKEVITVWPPTHNLALYRFLITHKFRLEEVAVFMADRPYPDFQLYVPGHLAVF